jgi:YidC/Oxa1 family membrane protein insertase
MDRRTLLAFALMFLVIMGFSELMRRDARTNADPAAVTSAPVEAVEPGRTDRAGDPAPGDGTERAEPSAPVPAEAGGMQDAAPLGSDDYLEPVSGDTAEDLVTVRTERFEVTLAERGARIVSWKGLSYPDGEGGPVELIPQGEESVSYGMDAVTFGTADLELGRKLFTADGPSEIEVTSGSRSVTFRLLTEGDLEIRKTYTFTPDSYTMTLDLEVAAAGPQAAAARAMLGDPRQVRFGWPQGIASTEGDDRLEKAAFRSFAKVNDELETKKRGGLEKDVEKVESFASGPVSFAGVQNKYFTVVGLPRQDGPEARNGAVVLSGDQSRNLQTWSITLPAQRGGGDTLGVAGLTLYIGPQEQDRLKAFGVGLDKTMDLGWALIRPLTEATLWIMDQMRRVIPNYGVIIILFSVLTKVAFYPLTRTSTQSMKRMQQLQPKIKALQEKYKDNQEKQSKAMMELYQKEKINPMAGCLPILLQMPVFVALYQALAHTIALRNTPFVGWIDDLSQPDALFSLPFSIPFLGSEFNLLPLLMTATMVVQMRMTPTVQPSGQMAMMNTLMPVIFLFFFYQMPSGLVLYWLVNNVVTIYQTWRIHKTAAPEGGQQTS